MLEIYEYKNHTVTAWTEMRGSTLRGMATITHRARDGRLRAQTYACPKLCGAGQTCLTTMRADINKAIDRGVFNLPPGG